MRLRLIGIFFCICFIHSYALIAQTSTVLHHDSVNGNGLLKINTKRVIRNIVISGNKVTRPQIIFRELLFKKGDTLTFAQLQSVLEQSQKNLLNTALFNAVTIDTTYGGVENVEVVISVTERWYIWPMPFFQMAERNFNVWWEDKDFSKADYGINLTWNNFRGRKESLVLMLRAGYNQTFGFMYKVPYVNRQKTIGFGVIAGFSGNHEVPFAIEANKQLFYKNKNMFVRQHVFGKVNLSVRKNMYNSHIFQIEYNEDEFLDTLHILNADYSKHDKLKYSSFAYFFRSDHRDFKPYPLNGYCFDLELTKHGLSVFKNENVDISYMVASYKGFWKMSKRWYFAGSLKGKLNVETFQPYVLQQGLGFANDFVRAYEYYVVNGQHYALLKTNLKYELIPKRKEKLKINFSKKFTEYYYSMYVNVLIDAAYVYAKNSKETNILDNSMLFGSGIGLDFVTYYDKVMRLEYAVNKKGESGFFIHFIAPI